MFFTTENHTNQLLKIHVASGKNTGAHNMIISTFSNLIPSERFFRNPPGQEMRVVNSWSWPILSMYGISTYIWLIFMENVGIIYHTWILWVIFQGSTILNPSCGRQLIVYSSVLLRLPRVDATKYLTKIQGGKKGSKQDTSKLGALKYHAQNRLAPLKLMNSLESWGSGAWDHKFQWFGLNHWKREYHKAPAQDKAINAGLEIKRSEILHKFNMSNTGTWSFNNSGWITKSRGGKSQTVEFRGKHIYRIIAK